MKYLISLIAGAGLAAAAPLEARATNSFFFTFGDSYSMSSFDVSGTQPTPGNAMGNPTLGTGTTGGGINWVGDLTTVYNASLVLSYNFAVGGASLDNALVQTNTKEDVVTQIASFQTAYSKKPATAPWSSDNAVFGIWIGINDIGWAAASQDSSVLVPKIMAQYKAQAEKLYADGGRKFIFLNVPSVSRSPMIIDQGEAVAANHAKWLAAFNAALKTMVNEFIADNSGTTTVLYDSFTFMTKVLDAPAQYGFTDATCVNDDGTTCVWWDNYHPGHAYHKLQAADMKEHMHSLGAW
ncbi:Lipase GDSL [Penicillium cf. griseofulvum]|uniref:Lipase GDSL n=1 Tax=Penicillium cf. griseofulvum TaxID=2972120 RepID=A0A9W9M193_9EURO|nr:Lipase GDSL [Penicillium cf. griseofulvum]KAJ5430247.1 Lipase GDSL [Penicillium cf. griseofulvum]KAJ5435984.1 Lipase GDSL [Penicillium cf. griseofulvum]